MTTSTETNNIPTPPEQTADKPKKERKPRGPRLDAKEFALFWDRATSKREVADHFKTTIPRVSQKAKGLREMGIPLKVFPKAIAHGPGDWEEIKKALAADRAVRGVDPNAFPVTDADKRKPRKAKDGAAANGAASANGKKAKSK